MAISRRSFLAAFLAAAAAPALPGGPGRLVLFAEGVRHLLRGDVLQVQVGETEWRRYDIERTGVVRGVYVQPGGTFELAWA